MFIKDNQIDSITGKGCEIVLAIPVANGQNFIYFGEESLRKILRVIADERMRIDQLNDDSVDDRERSGFWEE
jgi:hypothetical protein